MEQETVTSEVMIEKVRQRLGSLYGNAEQAVAEAIAIINEPGQRLSQQTEAPFVSANVSVTQYVAWSPEERLQYLNNAEKVNARWVKRQFQKLNAAWLMVIDGQVVAYDADVDNLPRAQDFNALCQKYDGKYPFVFFHPKLFMIEETTAWHATNEPDDAYPTVVVKLRGEHSESTLVADFDTGATRAYIDLNFLLQHGLLTIEAEDYAQRSEHLSQSFSFFAKPLRFSVQDQSGKLKEAELVVFCIKHWHASPFVAINPNRIALVGRRLFHKLAPIVHLDFAARQTEVEFHHSDS
jgi:hypothetical protein